MTIENLPLFIFAVDFDVLKSVDKHPNGPRIQREIAETASIAGLKVLKRFGFEDDQDVIQLKDVTLIFPYEPKEATAAAPTQKCSSCGSTNIGWDAWWDHNGGVNVGPFDTHQCQEWGERGEVAWFRGYPLIESTATFRRYRQ